MRKKLFGGVIVALVLLGGMYFVHPSTAHAAPRIAHSCHSNQGLKESNYGDGNTPAYVDLYLYVTCDGNVLAEAVSVPTSTWTFTGEVYLYTDTNGVAATCNVSVAKQGDSGSCSTQEVSPSVGTGFYDEFDDQGHGRFYTSNGINFSPPSQTFFSAVCGTSCINMAG